MAEIRDKSQTAYYNLLQYPIVSFCSFPFDYIISLCSRRRLILLYPMRFTGGWCCPMSCSFSSCFFPCVPSPRPLPPLAEQSVLESLKCSLWRSTSWGICGNVLENKGDCNGRCHQGPVAAHLSIWDSYFCIQHLNRLVALVTNLKALPPDSRNLLWRDIGCLCHLYVSREIECVSGPLKTRDMQSKNFSAKYCHWPGKTKPGYIILYDQPLPSWW